MTRVLSRRRYRDLALLLAAAWFTFPALSPARTTAAQSQAPVPPSPEEMERNLLRALNGERTARGLPVLDLSPALCSLARAHSAEMAQREILAHESAAGRSLTWRMYDATLTFAANGENVARSGTHLAELIHQSFMDSPGHRENILNPLFDQVGIGIVRSRDGAYYVTEDFRRALVEKPAHDVRAMVLGVLNAEGTAAGRPSVVHLEEADRAADALANDRAAGRPLPPLPTFYGRTLVRVAIGPDLEVVVSRLRSRDVAGYGRAGIGVWFGRHPEYPGGAYAVCAVLIKDSAGPGPDDLERLLAVLRAANEVRRAKQLPRLELDNSLCHRADEVIALRRKGKTFSRFAPGQGDVFFSMSAALDRLEEPLRARLEDPRVRRIGISTLPVQTRDGVSVRNAVAVILAR